MSCGIEVVNLKKSYISTSLGRKKRVDAVRGVSFSLGHGDVFGIIGPSGCGKSTIAKTLAGLLRPDEGQALVRGRLGFVSQNPYSSLSPVMRVHDIVSEPLSFNPEFAARKDKADMVRNALKKVRLDYDVYKNRFPSELSGGERQRVAIARALIAEPGVLILDEPVSMLDYDVKLEVIDILRDLSANSDYAVLVISHDIGFVQKLCTWIAVMNKGQIIEDGSVIDICENPKQELTKNLVRAALDLKAYLEE